jgi:hypothetical protein
MRKTIWIPLVLGGVLGLLDFVSLAVDFLIPLGPFGATGPQEILVIMSAALGGPIGLVIALVFQDLGIYLYFLNSQFLPEQMSSLGVLTSLADFAAHFLALLVLAYGYKLLHQRAKKIYTYLSGWILLIVIYYTFLVFFQSYLIGLVIKVHHPLSVAFQNNFPELIVVVIISTLILIALPEKYRRPLWIEQQPQSPPTVDGTVSKETQ